MDRYDPKQIEPKWQAVWADERTWEVSNEPDERPKAYVLEMLPYPSGEPHIGHLKNYALGDAVAHFQRRNGYRVLHPIGYDAFGLPAENHAINTGQHPRASTEASIRAFQTEFREWGVSFDWTREFATNEPRVYRWTQWIFLRLFERGLAYRKEAAVKWCPHDETVLANEQVINGRCERCDNLVEVRQLEQWFFRITEYADRLLDDMATIEWPENVVKQQRDWIGRSDGAEVTFRCEELGIDYPVFTTRPDTLFGSTFFVMAPEHPDVLRLNDSQEVRDYVNHAITERAEERGDEAREKTGVELGHTVTNPVTGEQIPMFVADYVLMEYGTGAIMAVPAHDTRDFEFAERFGLEIRRVIEGEELPYTGDGPMVNSGRFDGLHNRKAYGQIVEWLASEAKGDAAVNYRLRDWLLSRQRYWGCPIPIVHCERCGLVPGARRPAPGGAARRDRLPAQGQVAAGRGRGLGSHELSELWRRRAARDRHHGHLRRLLLVLPALLRPAQRHGRLRSGRHRRLDARGPVHRRHRARDPAPDVRALLRQGARGHGRARHPGAVRAAFHAGDDHPRRRQDVEVEGQHGVPPGDRRAPRRGHRALLRAFPGAGESRRRLAGRGRGRRAPLSLAAVDRGPRRAGGRRPRADGAPPPLLRKAHWAIDKVTRDMQADRFAFNTAIAAVMELVNEIYRQRESVPADHVRFAVDTAGSLIFPFAPHLGAEVYEQMTGRRVWEEPWPEADPALLASEEIQLVVQLNGKLIDRIAAPAEASREQLEEIARGSAKLAGRLNGQEIVKAVVVPGKLVNFVAR